MRFFFASEKDRQYYQRQWIVGVSWVQFNSYFYQRTPKRVRGEGRKHQSPTW